MQEEIGTGGAGFRYIYAYSRTGRSYLQRTCISDGSEQMTAISDQWRQFAAMREVVQKPSENGCRNIAEFLQNCG